MQPINNFKNQNLYLENENFSSTLNNSTNEKIERFEKNFPPLTRSKSTKNRPINKSVKENPLLLNFTGDDPSNLETQSNSETSFLVSQNDNYLIHSVRKEQVNKHLNCSDNDSKYFPVINSLRIKHNNKAYAINYVMEKLNPILKGSIDEAVFDKKTKKIASSLEKKCIKCMKTYNNDIKDGNTTEFENKIDSIVEENLKKLTTLKDNQTIKNKEIDLITQNIEAYKSFVDELFRHNNTYDNEMNKQFQDLKNDYLSNKMHKNLKEYQLSLDEILKTETGVSVLAETLQNQIKLDMWFIAENAKNLGITTPEGDILIAQSKSIKANVTKINAVTFGFY